MLKIPCYVLHINKNKLNFQNLRQSNDTYFVLLSLVLANQIAIVDKELTVHRIHEKSLEATRVKAPECFYYALKKLYETLKKKKIFKYFEQSFINYCFTFSFWHINSINNPKAQEKMLNKFAKLYNELQIKRYKEDYFYNTDIYNILKEKIKYKNITRQIFSLRNSEDKSHKIITIFGIKLKLKRKGR